MTIKITKADKVALGILGVASLVSIAGAVFGNILLWGIPMGIVGFGIWFLLIKVAAQNTT